MKRAAAMLVALACAACGGPKHAEHVVELTKNLPATLEAPRPREGDPKTLKVRVWADPGVRALPHWKEDITEQLDYASQLLTPLVGVRLSVDSIKDWPRAGEPHEALRSLAETDKGEGVTWVIGFIAPNDVSTKAMSELGDARPLGHHVIVRAWADKAETAALATAMPGLKDTERAEVVAAHRRHKQTVVLLHMLATTLGAIEETDPTWIQHPTYSAKQTSFSDRNRELLTLAIDDHTGDNNDQTLAKKLLEAIEKTEWGGWVPGNHDEVVAMLRNIVDATKAGKTASDTPPEAYDHITRVKELAKQGDFASSLAELDNLLSAYPGNAAMHQLRCDILLAKPGVNDKGTRAACRRVSELAPGDPNPHLAVGEALAKAGDVAGARAELAQAEGKIVNLPAGAAEAWQRVLVIYELLGALTWAEDALAKAKLDKDPVAARIAQIRARYGVPRGTKVVKPEQEGALVAAEKQGLELIYGSKFAEAEKVLAAADKRWPGAPGLAAVRCDLALRMGQDAAARAACAKAISADPNESWALYLTGVIALKDASGTKTGIASLKKAIAVDPDLGQAWRTLAKAYQRANDTASLEQLGKDYQAKFGQPLPP